MAKFRKSCELATRKMHCKKLAHLANFKVNLKGCKNESKNESKKESKKNKCTGDTWDPHWRVGR